MLIPVDSDNKKLKNLIEINSWSLSSDKKKISKTFQFTDFVSAFTFMTKIAFSAEKLNHHPEWFNVYNRLEINWSTHDIDGLSENDLFMAELCDELYKKC